MRAHGFLVNEVAGTSPRMATGHGTALLCFHMLPVLRVAPTTSSANPLQDKAPQNPTDTLKTLNQQQGPAFFPHPNLCARGWGLAAARGDVLIPVLPSPPLLPGPFTATETALLTTDPPWSMIFRGESVTLRCRGSQPSGQQPTTWYHNDKILARTATDTYRITNARQKQTGTYKCQSPGSVASNPITLIVSYGE